jgi:hypothetical protein
MTATTATATLHARRAKEAFLWERFEPGASSLHGTGLTRYVEINPSDKRLQRTPAYERQDTKIRCVNLSDEDAWRSEIFRRGHSVANAVLVRLAESSAVVHVKRGARALSVTTCDPSEFLVDGLTVDGIDCSLWFRVRLRGRDRDYRDPRNRMTLRYGGPPSYVGYGRRRSSFPREFEKQEPNAGFDAVAIAADIVTWVVKQKVRHAEEALVRARHVAANKAREELEQRFETGIEMVAALLTDKGVIPATSAMAHSYNSLMKLDFSRRGDRLEGYRAGLQFLQFLTDAAFAIAPRKIEPEPQPEPEPTPEPEPEPKADDAWLSWAKE